MSRIANRQPVEERWVAHVLVERGDRLLLLRRKEGRYLGGWWDVPGGTVEAGESLVEAAKRETAEESGLRVEIADEASHFVNADTGGRPIHFHTVTFHAILIEDGDVVLHPDEHDEHIWATAEEAQKLPLVWHLRRTLSRGPDGFVPADELT